MHPPMRAARTLRRLAPAVRTRRCADGRMSGGTRMRCATQWPRAAPSPARRQSSAATSWTTTSTATPAFIARPASPTTWSAPAELTRNGAMIHTGISTTATLSGITGATAPCVAQCTAPTSRTTATVPATTPEEIGSARRRRVLPRALSASARGRTPLPATSTSLDTAGVSAFLSKEASAPRPAPRGKLAVRRWRITCRMEPGSAFPTHLRAVQPASTTAHVARRLRCALARPCGASSRTRIALSSAVRIRRSAISPTTPPEKSSSAIARSV
mmetsp:Transcript_5572/g.13134  ORF Transcript_5572/g.13134 Transcript_5572/m.13134 type:complete len:272 (-) Transcript_5572:1359-2174(-)